MNDAKRILDERLASGEISTTEYEERLSALGGRAGTAPAHRQVGFVESMPLALKNYFNFDGRSSRGAFWFFQLWGLPVGFVTGLVDAVMFGVEPNDPAPVNAVAALALLIPNIAVTARRLHDVGRSGWWMLISFTIVGLIPLIYWYAQPGQRFENEFGDDVEAGRSA